MGEANASFASRSERAPSSIRMSTRKDDSDTTKDNEDEDESFWVDSSRHIEKDSRDFSNDHGDIRVDEEGTQD